MFSTNRTIVLSSYQFRCFTVCSSGINKTLIILTNNLLHRLDGLTGCFSDIPRDYLLDVFHWSQRTSNRPQDWAFWENLGLRLLLSLHGKPVSSSVSWMAEASSDSPRYFLLSEKCSRMRSGCGLRQCCRRWDPTHLWLTGEAMIHPSGWKPCAYKLS